MERQKKHLFSIRNAGADALTLFAVFLTAVFLIAIFLIGCGSAELSASQDPSDEAVQGEEAVPGDPSWARQFTTDFSVRAIDFSEVIAGGPPKDGIPSIDEPRFVSSSDAVKWLDPREPVLVVRWPGESAEPEAKIYPLQILMWHEIVNDRIGGDPVAVTYCPLCATGIVFLSESEGKMELEFGVTGLLRYSNMIMYDRQTESWWQQATGEAVAGALTGETLRFIPSLTLSFQSAREAFPDAPVLSRDTGAARPYGTNPYEGYDSLDYPFLYRGPESDDSVHPLEPVLMVTVSGDTQAVPYSLLREEGVMQFQLAGEPVAVFWKEGTASALDTRRIASGRDIGSANAFSAEAAGMRLDFRKTEEGFSDIQTGSVWDETGYALSGPLGGERLRQVTGIQHFWFSYEAFRPR